MKSFCGRLLVTILAFSVMSSVSTSAQDSKLASTVLPVFEIKPVGQSGSYITATLEPGSTETFTVALTNASDGRAEATRTFAADAFTLINGGLGIREESDPVTGTTTWLDYAPETLDLAIGQTVERQFNITVPEGTQSGQYISGLVLQTAKPIAVDGTQMLRQTIRKAIAVFITVPGPVTPELAIGAASLKQYSGANSLLIEIENLGNVLLKPTGTITMTTSGMQSILTAPVVMGSVYAGMATKLEIPIPMLLTSGTYIVAVDLADVATGTTVISPALPLSVTLSNQDVPGTTPIAIETMAVEPVRSSENDRLQFVIVTVALANTSEALPSARLTMHVTLNDVLLEVIPLNSSLVVPTGNIQVQQRYIPLMGWEPGVYGFSTTLEAVDATSGQVTVLANAAPSDPMTVSASDLDCGCPATPTNTSQTHIATL